MWQHHKVDIVQLVNQFDAVKRADYNPDITPLTPREKEILTLRTIGLHIKEISEKSKTSPHTVTKQLSIIRSKLGARNNEQAIIRAIILGLIHP